MIPATAEWISTAFLALTVIFLGALFAWMPRLTRAEVFFSITVRANFRDSAEGRAITRRFRFWILIHTLIGLGFVLAGPLSGVFHTQPLGMIWLNCWMVVSFLAARRRVRSYGVKPPPVPEAKLRPRPTGLPGGWLLQPGPFAIMAGVCLYLALHWDRIPQHFPIHFGWQGQPNRWSMRTVGAVFAPLFSGAAVCLFLELMSWATIHSARKIRAGGPSGQAEERFRSRVLGILLATEYFVAILTGGAALLPLAATETATRAVPFISGLTLLFLVVIVSILARSGQGGSRLAQQPDGPTVGDRTDDRYWKAGLFYVNPDDPALLVEKRFGLGYTLNFGHRASWAAIALLLVAPIVVAVLVLRSR